MKKNFFLRIVVFGAILGSSLSFPVTIDRVIIASDTNPMYIQFWPLVAKAWKEIVGIKPTLIVIADKDFAIVQTEGEVYRVEPLPGIPTSFQAQVIRLLIPICFEDDVCIISDMDMIPLQKDYFVNAVADIPKDHFVTFKDGAFDTSYFKEYPMCYNVALGKTFKEIFNITSVAQIPDKMREWYNLRLGWTTDQKILYQELNAWHEKTNRLVKLGHDVHPRVDRLNWQYNAQLLKRGYYIDAHLLRPYDQYKEQVDLLAADLGLYKLLGIQKIKVNPYTIANATQNPPLGNLSVNGEEMIIKNLIKEGDIVFDVGADSGVWSKCVLQYHPQNALYIFEPVPASAMACETQFRKNNVKVNSCAVSAKAAHNVPFFVYTVEPLFSALYVRERIEEVLKIDHKKIMVDTVTLDEFCAQENVPHINFLKLSVNGGEREILEGAQEMLKKKAIGLIQFEYGLTYKEAQHTLKDMIQLLTTHGYRIFKVQGDSITHIARWTDSLEDFYQSNYLAISAAEAASYKTIAWE